MDSKTVITRRTAIGAALVAATPLLLPGGYGRKGKLRLPIASSSCSRGCISP